MATLRKFGKISISTSLPEGARIVLRLIRITGKNLAKLRKSFGLDQSDVAAAIGVSQSLVSMMEREKHEPDGSQIIALQDYFAKLAGYKIILFFERDDKEKAPEEYWGQ